MNKLDAVKRSVRASAGPRAAFLQPSDNDALLAITLALAGEVATLYERVDTIERVAGSELGLTPEKLDAYVPTDEVIAERSRWHDAYIARLMRIVAHEVAELKAQDGPEIPARSAGD